MKVILVIVLAVAIAAATWFFVLREGGSVGGPVVSPPPASDQQKAPAQAPAVAPVPATKPARPTLAEVRAQQEKKDAAEEEFKPPPQIKLPDFLSGSPAKGTPEKKNDSVLDRIAFPVRALGWMIDNFWLLIIALVVLFIFSKSLFSSLIGLPFKILFKVGGEILEALFVRKSIFDAVGDKKKQDKQDAIDEKDGGHRRRGRRSEGNR
ncbi:MAG: hypothetical protein Q7R94_01690 [bacterium]|nr:hypothetical protein [bacterium]